MQPMKVFLSSTCFDLKQIRTDMFEFLNNTGFVPIQSEYSSFPINPNKDIIENCIDNVKKNTDILILIIGTRYGHQIDGNNSIVNTEYSFAKELGIPTYVFINKQLLSILPVWENNKEGDFTNIVDSPKIFEFVKGIRENERKWCFEFENVQDIIGTLKIQFSHLFCETLTLWRKFTTELPSLYNRLSPKAINILLKKEEHYEALFFAQALEDELFKHEELKQDLDFHLRFGSKEKISNADELSVWLSKNITSLHNYVQTSEIFMNKAFQKFYGEPGVPSDIRGLHYVACGLARLFRELIEWHNNILCTSVDDDYVLLRDSFALYTVDSAQKIWEFPELIRREITRANQRIKNGEDLKSLQIVLTLNIETEASKSFSTEMARLTTKLNKHFA